MTCRGENVARAFQPSNQNPPGLKALATFLRLIPIPRTARCCPVRFRMSDALAPSPPESFDKKWFVSHHAIEVPDPAATLPVWRFDPWHAEQGETDRDARATALLIPGWGGSAMKAEYLFLLAQVLRAEGCRVFFVDLPGVGSLELPPQRSRSLAGARVVATCSRR